MKRLTFDISEDDHLNLKVAAAKNKKSLRQFILEAIKTKIEKEANL